jgi:hypothetical protein
MVKIEFLIRDNFYNFYFFNVKITLKILDPSASNRFCCDFSGIMDSTAKRLIFEREEINGKFKKINNLFPLSESRFWFKGTRLKNENKNCLKILKNITNEINK